jgi:hypothetical protein
MHTWELLFGIENSQECGLSHHARCPGLQVRGLQYMVVDPHILATHHSPTGTEQNIVSHNSNIVIVC